MARTLATAAVLWAGVWAAAAQNPPAAAPGSTAAASPDALSSQIQALISAPAVSRAHWGVMVMATDGTPLAAVHEGELFEPASNAKLFTTAAAIALLGPDRTYATLLSYPAPGAAGVVTGDVVLTGSGDANLNGVTFPYSDQPQSASAVPAPPPDPLRYLAEFADRIAAANVKEIHGRIIGDDTVFPWQPYPANWSIDDMVWYYGAPISGLSIADNEMKVTVLPGTSPGDPADVSLGQEGDYFTLSSSAITAARKTQPDIAVDRAVGSHVVRVFGTIPVGGHPDTSEIAIPDPAEYAATALRQMLLDRGIRVDGDAMPRHRALDDNQGFLTQSRTPVAFGAAPAQPAPATEACKFNCPVVLEHTSPTVAEDIVYTNKTSQNLHAELLLRHLGKAYGTDGSTAQGARVVRQFLINAGIDPNDFVFYDGSGLSGHDLVTPRATARLLTFAATQPWFAQWKASLPVGGIDGSLGSRFKDTTLAGRVFAKTGTLGETRALSGYVECASGRTVVFSVMVGDFVPGTANIRETVDQIVAAIAAAE